MYLHVDQFEALVMNRAVRATSPRQPNPKLVANGRAGGLKYQAMRRAGQLTSSERNQLHKPPATIAKQPPATRAFFDMCGKCGEIVPAKGGVWHCPKCWHNTRERLDAEQAEAIRRL